MNKLKVREAIKEIVDEEYKGDFVAFWLDEFKAEGITKEQIYQAFESLEEDTQSTNHSPRGSSSSAEDVKVKCNSSGANSTLDVPKGCGKKFDIISYGYVNCGAHYNNILKANDNRIVFCPECKATLKQAEEDLKMFESGLEELKKEFPEGFTWDWQDIEEKINKTSKEILG